MTQRTLHLARLTAAIAALALGLGSFEIDARSVSGRAPALYAIREAAFSRNRDYEPATQSEWTARELDVQAFDPELTRVATRDGRPVGFATVRRWEDGVAYLSTLAVHPDAWGRGIGATLLTAVFAAAGAAGRRQVHLNVASDNPNALRLYERVGMTQRWRVDAYERPVAD